MGALIASMACTPAAAPAAPTAPPAITARAATNAPAAATSAPAPTTAPAAAAPAATPAGQPISIGVLDDVTGISSIEGALMRVDVDMAVDEINSSGGINGRPVKAVIVDPRDDASEALNLATELVQRDNVDVLVGGLLSPECLGVSDLAQRLGVVYMAIEGCATDELTGKSCNRYTFRVYPVANQTADPAAAFEVKTYGPNWGIIYPDYALGQSQITSNQAALSRVGGQLTVKIGIPLGETNVTPYVTRVPVDGSIQGLFVGQPGTDLARVVSVMQQFGITQKLPIQIGLGKEAFSGEYPDALNGALVIGTRPSEGLPNNPDDAAFMQHFHDWAQRDSAVVGPLGGPDKATPGIGNGYNAFVSMNALKLAMRAANFTGKGDTDKLISALEDLHIPQGPDAPDGPVLINKSDHQGRMSSYLLKINGQKEDVLLASPPESLPAIGTCQVA